MLDRDGLIALFNNELGVDGDSERLGATVTRLLQAGVPKTQVAAALDEMFVNGDDPVPVDEVRTKLGWGEYDDRPST